MPEGFSFADLLARAGGTEDPVLPPDTYTATVETAEAVIANSGNPMIKVKFSIVGGPHNGTWVNNNFVLALNSPKGDAALKPFFRQMGVFGITDEDFNAIPASEPVEGLKLIAPRLVGQTVTIKTDIREYEGKKYPDVKSVAKASGTTPGVPQVGVPQVPAAASIQAPPAVPAIPQVPAPAPAPPVAAPVTPGAPPPPPF